VQEDLLKEKELEILSLKKSQAKDELIIDELTRESFLAKDACKKLEGENLELQKSFESLKTSLMALVKASRPLIRVLVINDNHCGLTFLFEL
jgi:hypothetical protein